MSALRIFVTALTLVCFTGCATTTTIEQSDIAAGRIQVHAGDAIRITLTDNKVIDAVADQIDKAGIKAHDDARKYDFRWSQVSELEVKGVSKGRTIGGVFIAVGAVATVVLLVLFVNALKKLGG